MRSMRASISSSSINSPRSAAAIPFSTAALNRALSSSGVSCASMGFHNTGRLLILGGPFGVFHAENLNWDFPRLQPQPELFA
jgi:hypothetical protein